MKPVPARFWDFSLAVYGRPGVKEACLALQDQGLDVNIALWIAYTAAHGRDPRPGLGQAARISALWAHRVVMPLRTARDRLKPAPGFVDADGAARLRGEILKVELEAERLEQEALDPLTRLCPKTGEPGKSACTQGLEAYAARLDRRVDSAAFVETVFSALEKR